MRKLLSKRAKANGNRGAIIMMVLLVSKLIQQGFDNNHFCVLMLRTAPSVAKVKEMCDEIAKFHLDHMLDFPSKDAITTFSEQCGSSFNKMNKRLKDAFANHKKAKKRTIIHRPMSGVSLRRKSKVSESFKGKSLTPRARGTSLTRVDSAPRAGSGFKPQLDFKALSGTVQRKNNIRDSCSRLDI